ncbi:hypothetical protein [Polyangium aurulentum]|uniref:hypothetical protein n=1 Tax=Polyangium aurulentum TaxID=2567896 RepID=UPI0010ADE3AE|nr:hypothetical protein [Polyangium aurulentum]UQA61001.1 hypothetical protein E8A73_011195 [Polyangium aurulentum]
MESSTEDIKLVWALTEKEGRKVWAQVGVAWEAGELLFARLDAMPLSGRLCLRAGGPPSARSEVLQ